MKYFTYILRSEKDKRYYVGITQDIDVRFKYHNLGKVRSTKSRIPLPVIYKEEFNSRAEAREREKYFKSYKGSREKLNIIENL